MSAAAQIPAQSAPFIVHRRDGNTLRTYQARLVRSRAVESAGPAWVKGQPVNAMIRVAIGAEVPFAEHYTGHCAWVERQIIAQQEATARARAARKGGK